MNTEQLMPYGDYTLTERVRKTPIFGGVATQKKPEKKTVPNLKFAVAFGFCGTFSVFFRLNFDKKFQPFKNHVNNEILGGQELPNNTHYA